MPARRRLLPLLLLLLALTTALAVVPTASATTGKVPRSFFGTMFDGPLLDGHAPFAKELSLVHRTRIGYIRAAVIWRIVEPTRPASSAPADVDAAIDFSSTDQLMRQAAYQRVAVLPVPKIAPDWASSNPGQLSAPPSDPRDFADFLGALARRYGPRGTFWSENPALPRFPIRSWQVWNEPNLTTEWDAKPWAPSYVALLRSARQALKAVDPHARVVLAGLPNRSWEALRTLYDAGARGLFDAAAIHPYTAKVANVIELVRRMRKVMNAHGDRRVPLWVTELGWPSARKDHAAGIGTTRKGQAKRLTSAITQLVEQRRRLGVGSVCVYTWISRDTGDNGWDYAGLRAARKKGPVAKPAFYAVKRLLARISR
jgi:Glycosyl hydrolase catalytic core